MKPDAPVLHEGAADDSVPEGMSPNVMARYEFGHGDIEAGFAKADMVLERHLQDRGHAPGLYRAACLPRVRWARTARPTCGAAPKAITSCATPAPAILGMEHGQLRVTASEIGGGFGGKTTVFMEPVALALAANPAARSRW